MSDSKKFIASMIERGRYEYVIKTLKEEVDFFRVDIDNFFDSWYDPYYKLDSVKLLLRMIREHLTLLTVIAQGYSLYGFCGFDYREHYLADGTLVHRLDFNEKEITK